MRELSFRKESDRLSTHRAQLHTERVCVNIVSVGRSARRCPYRQIFHEKMLGLIVHAHALVCSVATRIPAHTAPLVSNERARVQRLPQVKLQVQHCIVLRMGVSECLRTILSLNDNVPIDTLAH